MVPYTPRARTPAHSLRSKQVYSQRCRQPRKTDSCVKSCTAGSLALQEFLGGQLPPSTCPIRGTHAHLGAHTTHRYNPYPLKDQNLIDDRNLADNLKSATPLHSCRRRPCSWGQKIEGQVLKVGIVCRRLQRGSSRRFLGNERHELVGLCDEGRAVRLRPTPTRHRPRHRHR